MNDHAKPRPMPKRSKAFGVGKEMPGALYVHRSCVPAGGLMHSVDQVVKLCGLNWYEFDVVKISLKNDNISFVWCEDFDKQAEPVISRILTVGTKGPTYREYGDIVYHHKWLMVYDDYLGFDVEESKRRSAKICAIPGLDYSRCGKLSIWKEIIAAHGLDD